jgi:Uma2 family endonuclease
MGPVNSLPDVRRFTVAEYLRLAEVGVLRPEEKVELIDGQIVAMSPHGPVHSALVSRIVAQFVELFPRDRYCVRPQCTMVLGEAHAPEPDIAVVEGPCEDHERELPRTALLIVEVADSSVSFDRGRKADIYARAGIPEYWLVDVGGGRVEVRRDPSSIGYQLIRLLRPEDALSPLALGPAATRGLLAADLLPR